MLSDLKMFFWQAGCLLSLHPWASEPFVLAVHSDCHLPQFKMRQSWQEFRVDLNLSRNLDFVVLDSQEFDVKRGHRYFLFL